MATIVNLFVPGLGQLLQGRAIMGMMLFMLTLLGYICFVLPGIVMHILTLVDSAQYDSGQRHKAHKEILRALKNNNR